MDDYLDSSLIHGNVFELQISSRCIRTPTWIFVLSSGMDAYVQAKPVLSCSDWIWVDLTLIWHALTFSDMISHGLTWSDTTWHDLIFYEKSMIRAQKIIFDAWTVPTWSADHKKKEKQTTFHNKSLKNSLFRHRRPFWPSVPLRNLHKMIDLRL